MSIIGFLCYLLVAAVSAFIAERMVPGVIPGGFLTAAVVGIIGAWVGGNMMGHFGPDLAGIALIPCILGSALLIFCLSFFSRAMHGRRA